MNGLEIDRRLNQIIQAVPFGDSISIEGTPLYAGQPWQVDHEFGYNEVLFRTKKLLEEQGLTANHYAMLDDFTTGVTEDFSTFAARISDNPIHWFYESQFAQEAEEIARDLQRRDRTINVQGELLLAAGNMPLLKARSGRVSCELLDACFQRQKIADTNIIIHPKVFSPQQSGMREILREISGRELPASLLNIFFKNNSISTVIFTDKNGRARNL